jgi:hypothetical protein
MTPVKVKVAAKPSANGAPLKRDLSKEAPPAKPPAPAPSVGTVITPRGATVNKDDFVHLLDTIRAGLSPREIVEQSSCVAFKDGRVTTYNEEIMCSAPSGLPKEWTAAVQHKPLFDQSAGSRLLELNMERQVLMPLDGIEKPGNDWKPLHDDFTDAVGIVESCAGKDESNVALTCVHITEAHMEACDNFQLTRYKFKTGIKECCVKRDALKIVPALDMREYTETESWLHFRGRTGLIVSIRKHKEDYTDLAPFLEVEGVKTVLPKSLSEAVERAKLLSDENADNPVIKVDLQPGKVKIRGEGASGYFTEAKKVKYAGPGIKFVVSPTLFLELVKRHTDCVVSPNYRIKVDGPKWRYVACLQPAEVKKEE